MSRQILPRKFSDFLFGPLRMLVVLGNHLLEEFHECRGRSEVVAIRMNSQQLADGAMQLFHVFLYGILAASFGANYLASVRPKT